MSLTLSNNTIQNYPTNPAAYPLQRGGSTEAELQNLIQELGQMLQQLQGGAGGAPSGSPTAMPGAPGGTPSPTGGALPATGGAGGSALPATGGAGQMTAQNASGVLASYMGSNNIGSLDPNAMYQLAQNANGNTPPTVQQAAQFMMANPSAYKQIETHDVAGTDGKSATGNFQWAAQGGLGTAGNAPGVGAGATPTTTGAMPGTTGFTPSPTGSTPSPTGFTPSPTGFTPSMTGSMPAATMPPSAQPGTTGDLVNDGKPLQKADEGQALSAFNQQDPAGFQAFESALSHGDGNTAAHVLANSVSSGKISQATGAALGAQLQQTANAHGGGKINDDAKNALKSALGGDDVLAPGKTRGAIAFTNLTGINTTSILGVSTQ